MKADVLNVIPPQRAGAIAAQAGVITANNRWCEVDFLSFESIKVPKRLGPSLSRHSLIADQHVKLLRCSAFGHRERHAIEFEAVPVPQRE